MIKKQQTPLNIKKILSRLGKNECELGEFFLKNTIKALRSEGYTEANVLVTAILPHLLGELECAENFSDVESLALKCDGAEKNIVESLCTSFSYLANNLKKTKQKDIKDALVYSISQTLEKLDKEKYAKLYG